MPTPYRSRLKFGFGSVNFQPDTVSECENSARQSPFLGHHAVDPYRWVVFKEKKMLIPRNDFYGDANGTIRSDNVLIRLSVVM